MLGALAHWHLLSLDAPTVAVLWTWFIARANHIVLPPTALIAMGLAVWMLYAADRILDSRDPRSPVAIASQRDDLEARHYFHRRHQRVFRIGIIAASALLALLLPKIAPQSIRLYLVLGTLLFAYFVLIHAFAPATPARPQRLPKELAVGIFFSAAIFIPTVARANELRPVLLPVAVLFAVVCCLNCLFIHAWEHPLPSPQIHAVTRTLLHFLPHITITSILAGITIGIADRTLPWFVPVACALAACFLLSLHHSRQRFSPTTLRAAADLCLLTPALLVPLLRH